MILLVNDSQKVTFSSFLKTTVPILAGTIIYVSTIIPAIYGKNCIILSLFLMLSMAFVYVVLLYVAYDKLIAYSPRISTKHKNRAIGWIYEGRMAVKTGIMLLIISEAAKELVLRRYNAVAVAIPVLVAATYIGSRGLRGVVRFAEAVFWFAVVSLVIVFVMSLRNIDLSQLRIYTQFVEENGINCTINRIMSRGGLLFLGFSFMEMVVLLYMDTRNRRRGMLVSVTGISLLIGLIGSVIVTTTLGYVALAAKRKDILYIVGAMVLPGGIRMRPLLVVCYLLVVWGMLTMTPHVACAFEAVERLSDIGSQVHKQERGADCVHECSCRYGFVKKMIWVACVFAVCIGLQYLPVDLYRLIPGYLLLVDVPLSIILPLLAVNWKKCVRGCSVLLLCVGVVHMCTSCAYESVEDVDYATVLVIESTDPGGGRDTEYKTEGESKNESNTDLKTELKYTLVLPEIGVEGEGSAGERVYSVCAGSFDNVRRFYNEDHANRLDTSHVEYIVADSDKTMAIAGEELEKEFATSYVTVIKAQNILGKTEGDSTKEYLRSHYKGQCLASYQKK